MKLLGSIGILFISSAIAIGCSCVNHRGLTDTDYRKHLSKVAAIFEAEVVALGEIDIKQRQISSSRGYDEATRPVTFKVSRAWKGVDEREITVSTDVWSSCGLLPSLGAKDIYYAYVSQDDASKLSINYCSVRSDEEDQQMMKELGTAQTFIHAPPSPQFEELSIFASIWQAITSFFS